MEEMRAAGATSSSSSGSQKKTETTMAVRETGRAELATLYYKKFEHSGTVLSGQLPKVREHNRAVHKHLPISQALFVSLPPPPRKPSEN